MEHPTDDLNSEIISLKIQDSAEVASYDLKITLGILKRDSEQAITATPEALFQDNCLIVGTVGSGKTWTMSRLMEECLRFNSKLVLFDLNEEFKDFHTDIASTIVCNEACIPFEHLNISEILELLSFKDETQKAIFLEMLTVLQTNDSAIVSNSHGLGYTFSDILELLNSVLESDELSGDTIAVRNHVLTRIYEGVFVPFIPASDKVLVSNEIEGFLSKKRGNKLLRLSFRGTPSQSSTSRVFINCITRYLKKLYTGVSAEALTSAVIFLDDAEVAVANNHDNLNAVKDFFDKSSPNSLRCCLSVNNPLEIPLPVLKSVGSFIIHRLKFSQEIDFISHASSLISEQDKATIPMFISGDALLLNARLYAPYLLRIAHPEFKPSVKDSMFQSSWR